MAEDVYGLQYLASAGTTSVEVIESGPMRVCVRARGRGYLLTGSNPRSVLFAVYRYLHAAGFRWVRPGAATSWFSPIRINRARCWSSA